MHGIAHHNRRAPALATKVKGERTAYTDTSPQALSLPAAVTYASARKSVLQSAGEAVVFRCIAQGTRHETEANAYQMTRTAAIYFERDGRYYAAFDDDPDPARNILLSRAQEGHDAHNQFGKWLVKKDDPTITLMLANAERLGRIIEVPTAPCSFSTLAHNGISGYGTSGVICATLHGCPVNAKLTRPQTDAAEHYARFLQDHHDEKGYVYFLPRLALRRFGVDADHVEVRRVGVGGAGDALCNLYATDHCDFNGRARGVRKTLKVSQPG